ncbi:MAG: AAA family ATPase [Candidatus Kapabacteria bacterium]|nr:AAA family ATPase [Candidatus Kapabacteria bacterium]
METPQKPPAVYFQSLTIENVRCFKGEHTIDLSDGNGKPSMWTVILGNNNTGKTTLLRCLADLEPDMAQGTKIDGTDSKGGFLQLYSLKTPKILQTATANERKDKYLRTTSDSIAQYVVSGELIGKINSSYRTLRQLLEKNGATVNLEKIWAFGSDIMQGVFIGKKDILTNMKIYSYGVSRRASQQSLPTETKGVVLDPFIDTIEYTNVDDWLFRLHIAKENGEPKALIAWDLTTQMLIDAMPDARDIQVVTKPNTLESYVAVQTTMGIMPLRNLGYGYQSAAVWLVDFAQKMLQRYGNVKDTFAQPAIVLIDELDSHLHPEWQRTIISTLSKQFPATQFIVTTHSPLLVQSFEKVNLVVLHKNTEDDSVQIEQYRQQSFQGWTVEEILRDVMRMGERTYSDKYLEVQRAFVVALENDDYTEAKRLRDELKKMMKKDNPDIHLLDMQVSALNGVADD